MDSPSDDAIDRSPEDEGHDIETPWWAPEGAAQTDLPAPQRPDLSPGARAVENQLVSHFDGHDLSMPPLPRSAETVLSLLGNRNCDFGRVADEIADDQVLAAVVLRAVNSPMYCAVDRITALKPAVARLGVKALRTLVMHQALRAATFMQSGGDQDLATYVWRRSVMSAHVMRGLAPFCRVEPEQAFLIGLLHDIGNVIVLRIVCGEETIAHERIDLPAFEYLCRITHQEFGELVAEAWKLPEELVSLIRDHHTPPTSDNPLRTERLMLQATEMIVSMIGPGSPAVYDLQNSRPFGQLGLFQQPDFRDFLDRLPADLEDATGFI
jgi:HD-like signal output (HDOD) protein